MRSEDEELFARGVALFNCGEYFACHEVWEELWQRSAGDDRIALQGLIQAAAALLHAQRGNRRGALSVYRKAVKNLEATEDCELGLEIGLGDFRRSLGGYFEMVEKGMTIPFSPRLNCERKPLRPKG